VWGGIPAKFIKKIGSLDKNNAPVKDIFVQKEIKL
jgi:hypothetical protein